MRQELPRTGRERSTRHHVNLVFSTRPRKWNGVGSPAVQSHRKNSLTSARPAKSSHHTDCRHHRSALKRFALAKRRQNPIFPAPLIGIETAWDKYRPSGDQSITGDGAISGP